MQTLTRRIGTCLLAAAALLTATTATAVTDDTEPAPAAVDMGLSVRWADRNLGAETAEGYGLYFWWGDTTGHLPGDGFPFSNNNPAIATHNMPMNTLRNNGIVDSNHRLTPRHDAAQQLWGEGWHTPTYAEWQELKQQCQWTWVQRGNVQGYEVKAKNGNSIFLPAAGQQHGRSLCGTHGYYWSATGRDDLTQAYHLQLSSLYHSLASYYRFCGESIRPVKE